MISAFDDLCIDFYYIFLLFIKKINRKEKYDLLHTSKPFLNSEKNFAVMLPAWQEKDIIRHSIENLIKTIDYQNYEIFIGVYPNDIETQKEINKLTRQFSQVHKVVTSQPSPTCKADCLNAIVDYVYSYELEANKTFTGFIIHDAEDVVHPLSLKVFNHLMPIYDLVQIPVLSLERKWQDLTGGHYMEEFAEYLSKEIPVREHFAGVVPGAGVGLGYSRKALEFAAVNRDIFNTLSLTEDYEFSFRMRKTELKQTFVNIPIRWSSLVTRSHKKSVKKSNLPPDRVITYEYFPNQFWSAVRQKTRWIIGISFQGWDSLGWRGNWRIKYLFWRDRKMVLLIHAVPLALISLIIFAALYGYEIFASEYYGPLSAVNVGMLSNILKFNSIILIYRLLQRHLWSYIYYGWSTLPTPIPL